MNRLKEIRKSQGLTQLDLAIKTGILPNEISRLENDKTHAYPGWKRRICLALEVEEADIWPEREDR